MDLMVVTTLAGSVEAVASVAVYAENNISKIESLS
jgi:hypothetical protein